MSGDDKVENMEEPEVLIDRKRWIQSSEYSESHGDKNESLGGSSGGSPPRVHGDEETPVEEEGEVEDNETVLVNILPEITAEQLLRLPRQYANNSSAH